jgi:MFS family permease
MTSRNRMLPASASADAVRLITSRALRGFSDGAVSVLLPSYLTAIGFGSAQIGAIVFSTLLGSAGLTLWVGLLSHRLGRRHLLLASTLLMFLTGLGFAFVTSFWILLLVAFVGTLNPSAGDVSLFLPLEQSALAETVVTSDLTAMFAQYNVAGAFAAALGALASGLPAAAEHVLNWTPAAAQRIGFFVYSAIAVAAAIVYLGLSSKIEGDHEATRSAPLAKSRSIVIRLSALFSIDAFGGGFVVQSLLALWLFKRFHLSVATAGTFFFVAGLLGSFSQIVSARLAARFGRINTMVFTHLPASIFLILAAIVPNAHLAIALLLLRASVSSMDVPARQSYVMAVVPPEERAAAASVTNVPRSLASAFAPLPSGLMLEYSTFGWPLICCGVLKAIYDVLLLFQFRAHRPPDE